MISLFILLYFTFFNIIQANIPRIWKRIPQFFVTERVESFINENRINNCFEFRESETNLLLKCWRDNQLADVSIDINPGKRRYSGLTISI